LMTVEDLPPEFKPSMLLILLLLPSMPQETELFNVDNLLFHSTLVLQLPLTLALEPFPMFLTLITLFKDLALDPLPLPELGPLLMLVETLLLLNKPSLLLILLPQLPLLMLCVSSHQMDSTNATTLPILLSSMLLMSALLPLSHSTMTAAMSTLEIQLDATTIQPLNNCASKPLLTTAVIPLTLSPSLPLMLAETLPFKESLFLFPMPLEMDKLVELLMFASTTALKTLAKESRKT